MNDLLLPDVWVVNQLHCLTLLVPGVPMFVKLKTVDSNSLLVSWLPPLENADYVDRYVIQWSKGEEEQENIDAGNNNEYTITDLKPGQSITVSVAAYSRYGGYKGEQITGPCSEPQQITMPEKGGRLSLAFLYTHSDNI